MNSIILFMLTVLGIAIVAVVYLRGNRRLLKRYSHRFIDFDGIYEKEDISEHIKSLLFQYISLTVKFDERGMEYHSHIKDFDTDVSPHTFSLEPLEPKEGNILALDSNYVSITYQYPSKKYVWPVGQKITYGFITACIPPDSSTEETNVKLLFPEAVERVQKRDFLRIEPPYDKPVFAKFVSDGVELQEPLINISGGGFGFFTTRGMKTFAKGSVHYNVALNIQNTLLPIEQVRVVNIIDRTKIVGRGGKTRFFCGFQFEKIDERVRKKIIQYVIQVEREGLRRLSRMFD